MFSIRGHIDFAILWIDGCARNDIWRGFDASGAIFDRGGGKGHIGVEANLQPIGYGFASRGGIKLYYVFVSQAKIPWCDTIISFLSRDKSLYKIAG